MPAALAEAEGAPRPHGRPGPDAGGTGPLALRLDYRRSIAGREREMDTGRVLAYGFLPFAFKALAAGLLWRWRHHLETTP